MGTHLYLQRSVSLGSSIIELSDVPDRQGTPFFEDGRSVIELGMRFNQAEASQGTFVFADPKGDPLSEVAYAFPLGHLLVTWTDDATGPELWIFRGRVANAEGGRAIPKVNHEVQWETTADDGNVDLRGQAFAESWARPEETDVARLVALQAYTLNGSSSTATHHRDTCEITVNTSHLAPNSNTVTMPAKKYPAGTQPDEVVRDCADTAGKEYGVVIHHTGGSHLCLLYIVNDDNSTYASTIKISDQLADWNPEDLTAPVFEPHWERGSGTIFGMQTLLSGMVGIWGASEDGTFVEYGGGAVADAYDYWVEAYHDGISTTSGQAANRTAGILEGRRQTNVTHKASIIILPEQIPLIGAGMSIQVKGAAFGTADYITRRVAECRFEPRLDGRYWCHLDVTRPPLRVAPGRGRVGPIPPSQNEPPGPASSDALWTFADDNLDTTATWAAGTLATNWHPGYVHTHVGNPGVGNTSAASHPPVTAGNTYHVRGVIARNTGTPYNPAGIYLDVYSHPSATLLASYGPVTSYSGTTVGGDVVIPGGDTSLSWEVPYNASYVDEVEFSHGSVTPAFEGTAPPGAATGPAGSVGTSPIYAPIDHTHPAQTAAVTPVADDAGRFVGASVEDVLAEFILVHSGGRETLNVHGSAGSAETIDLADGNVHDLTLDDDCVITLSGATSGEGCSLLVAFRQDGTGGWTVNLPASVVGDTDIEDAISLDPSTVTWVAFWTIDGGTTWYASVAGGTSSSSVAALDDLTDVTITSPDTGDMLRYESGVWVNQPGRWEVVVDGNPATAVTTEAGTDWVYGWNDT